MVVSVICISHSLESNCKIRKRKPRTGAPIDELCFVDFATRRASFGQPLDHLADVTLGALHLAHDGALLGVFNPSFDGQR